MSVRLAIAIWPVGTSKGLPLGLAKVRRKDARRELLTLPGRSPVSYTLLVDLDGFDAGYGLLLRQVAVANHLLMATGIHQVGSLGQIPGHLVPDGLAKHVLGALTQDLREHIPRKIAPRHGRQWKCIRLGVTLTHGGVSLPMWAIWVSRQHPGYAAFFHASIHKFRLCLVLAFLYFIRR